MKSIFLKRLLLVAILIIVIFVLIWFAAKSDAFWVNLSLNLLTEIVGAVLIAWYLQSGLRDTTDHLNLVLNDLADRTKIDRAFSDENAEVAWDIMLRNKYKRLKITEKEYNRMDASDVEAKQRLSFEIKLLTDYIFHATGKSPSEF
jgi:hypothetical protein